MERRHVLVLINWQLASADWAGVSWVYTQTAFREQPKCCIQTDFD